MTSEALGTAHSRGERKDELAELLARGCLRLVIGRKACLDVERESMPSCASVDGGESRGGLAGPATIEEVA